METLLNNIRKTPETDEFAITRKLYPYESMFEFLCSTLSGGAFFAKLSITLGVKDSVTALISSITYLVCIVQIFSGALAKHTPIKPWLLPISLFTRVCMIGMFLLPFLNISSFADIILLILVFCAQSTHMLLYPIKQTMFLTTVPETERTGYLARHNRVSVIAGIPIVMGGGLFIDKMTEVGKLDMAFLIIALAILFFCICHMTILFMSKEPPIKVPENKNMLLDFKKIFKSSKYRLLFILAITTGMGVGALSPFLSTYIQREQGFSMALANFYTMLQYIFMICTLSLLSKFRHRIKPTLMHAIYFAGNVITNGIFFVMNNDTALVFHFFFVFFSSINSAALLGITSLIYNAVDEDERTTAVAVHELAKGLSTFFMTLCISPFFDHMQTNGVSLFGRPVFAQQILAIISTSIMIVNLIIWLCNKNKFTEMDKGISFRIKHKNNSAE